jgi:hypothetical protein
MPGQSPTFCGAFFDGMHGLCTFLTFADSISLTFPTPKLTWDVAFGINATGVTFGIFGASESIIMTSRGSIEVLVSA